MRIAVLGGTRFIGRRIVTDLVERGDEVLVVHRGETEPADLPPCRHLHVARSEFASRAPEVVAFSPDAVIDTLAMSRADADTVLPHLPQCRLVMLSSVDVYQAFGHVLAGTDGVPVPITESSPVRSLRFPYEDRPDYDKLEVEPAYLARGATVLRLAMIYGEHDGTRREEFILRRVRAGRRRIPVGPGSWLWTRCYVGDVAGAVLAALATPASAGQVFNVGEPVSRSIMGWSRDILAAAGHDAELVRVPEQTLPDDLWITKTVDQHVLLDSGRAEAVLDWRPADPTESSARSVTWHLANPPAADPDFSADDAALAA